MSKNSKSGNNKPKQQQQQQPVCIFCKKRPLTKEHLWPDWIKTVIEKDDSRKHEGYSVEINYLGNDQFELLPPNINKKNGHILNRTLKIVCEDCNNKWMSQIEDKAKPILELLISSSPIVLNRIQQKLIVQWAVLRTIISEFTDEKTKVVTAKERREFYETKEVPDNWYVWIAKKGPNLKTQKHTHYHHMSLEAAYRQADGTYKMSNGNYNTQSSYFEIGQLIIYTFSWPETLKYQFTSVWASKMIRLHPKEYYEINWSDIPVMSDTEIKDLERNIVSIKNQIRFLSRT